MKSKDTNKSVSVKDSSLGQVISENEKIEESIKDAANELASINQVIKKKTLLRLLNRPSFRMKMLNIRLSKHQPI